MTEGRLAEFFDGLKAHREALARAAGDLAESGNRLADLALRLDKMRMAFDAEECMKASSLAARLAHELATGLEALDRLAGTAMDDTRPMSMDEIAAINAEDAEGD